MITIQEFLECIEYKITSSDEYLWRCFGPNARSLDYWNKKSSDDQVSICAVLDTETQVLYTMEAWDGPSDREYRWINPDFKDAFLNECKARSIDPAASFDDNKYIDLDVEEDMIKKACAIFAGTDYDTRIQVTLDLSGEDELMLMRMAHERDMTVNAFIEEILRNKIAELEFDR